MELINEFISLPLGLLILLILAAISAFLVFVYSCLLVGFISYKLTYFVINYILGEKLNVKIISKDGTEENHIITYKKGDDISIALKKLKGS